MSSLEDGYQAGLVGKICGMISLVVVMFHESCEDQGGGRRAGS